MATVISLKPDYIFEVSWEVCNKVGGIHTVIATKAKTLQGEYGDKLILIGPDIPKDNENDEFIEDKTLYKSWQEQAETEGLKFRIGRWNTLGKPIAILINFSGQIQKKDTIFSSLWTKFGLDSITGQWDYIEPAIFGYAAGQIIESFYRYYLDNTIPVAAQFHEWMTGAGILYLRDNAPKIATVFTTHATVAGRAIAGNGLPFYSRFDSFSPEQVIKDFNITAKSSLERVSAIYSDCFSTVSEITARECKRFLGKAPDIILHNGIDLSIVPKDAFAQKRLAARSKLLQVARALFNQNIPDDTLLVIKSGRYEFKNKGIDVFIDSIAQASESNKAKKDAVAFLFVPAANSGPRKELVARLQQPDYSQPLSGQFLTHNLQNTLSDTIFNKIKTANLNNAPGDNIKLIYVPSYLDGHDGIFNMAYYDLLIGFDLGIFPSYYEPFGYTPLESIAFHVPAVTTNVSGFGELLNSITNHPKDGMYVLERTDGNERDIAKAIAGIITGYTQKTTTELELLKNEAADLSKLFQWDKLIVAYKQAYDIALQKSTKRTDETSARQVATPIVNIQILPETKPVWRKMHVQSGLPKTLAALQKLSENLWLSWNYDAFDLFNYIDADTWETCNYNPILFLQSLGFDKIRELEKDEEFVARLNAVEKNFDRYINAPIAEPTPMVAYFSMEFGITSYIKLYSGGLGVLAGDFLKEASDQRANMIAVGLLYKNGYFHQAFSLKNEQLAAADTQAFVNLPLQMVKTEAGAPMIINIDFPGRILYAQLWKLNVGRVPLYLLDTNISENSEEDRNITGKLYDSDPEMRIKQEIVLGIGGIHALHALGLHPDVYHCNEGHAAFIGIERTVELIQNKNLTFEEALEYVKNSTLFTTHTAVPAANDIFSEDTLKKYLFNKTQTFNVPWDSIMGLGRSNKNDHEERFSMTFFASQMSLEINAVSKVHKKVSDRLLNPIWKDFSPNELHIGSVTNGVHYETWTAKQFQQLYKKFFGKGFLQDLTDKTKWDKIRTVPDDQLWNVRKHLKSNMIACLRKKLNNNLASHEDPKKILQIINALDEHALIIGFARRFATYKRSNLLMTDIKRLQNIISKAGRPVQFIFSGKAHPNDHPGSDIIKSILDVAAEPEFENSIFFIEDYDMEIAKLLVSGVDVWMNTPVRLMEASGTSGMKAALNGVINFSVLDGWWMEAYDEELGWALKAQTTYERQDFQNQLDAETIYNILETEIIPLYFERDSMGVPVNWMQKVKACIAGIGPEFTMTRMLDEYQSLYYHRMYDRIEKMRADNYAMAKELAAWKKKMVRHWREVEVISTEIQNKSDNIAIGDELMVTVTLSIGALRPEDIGVEIVFKDRNPLHNADDEAWVSEFALDMVDDQKAIFKCTVSLMQSGPYDYGFRIYAKNPLLAHRQDFPLIKWI